MLTNYLLRISLALLCLAACFPRPARADEVQYGMVRGVVRLENGKPVSGQHLLLTAGGKEISAISDADGAFSCMAPAGEATLVIGEVHRTLTIHAGEVNRVELSIKPPGVVLTLTAPDALPPDLKIHAAFKAPSGAAMEMDATPLDNGRFWFPAVPPEATAFAVVLSSAKLLMHQRWDFTAAAGTRALTLSIPAPGTAAVTVVNNAGVPLANTPVTGTLTLLLPKDAFWDTWENPADPNRQLLNRLNLFTDAAGKFTIKSLCEATYELTLRAGFDNGSPVKFGVKSDNTVGQLRYTLTNRTVTQTIFGADDKPLANAVVRASFAWNGRVVFLAAKADAHGVVTWPALPPVRVIVWGENVPPGVLPPDAVTVTAPLPLPSTGNWQPCNILPVLAAGDTSVLSCRCLTANENRTNLTLSSAHTDANCCHLTSGQPFSLLGMSETTPPRAIRLINMYAPYVDDNSPLLPPNSPLELPLTSQPAARIHGHFVSEKGKPFAGVTQVSLQPVGGEEAKAIFHSGIMQLTEHSDGSFTLATPLPGAYRLLVDLFEDSGPVEQLPLLQVEPGTHEMAITLPDPLLTVPGGTELNWITAVAPASPRRLTVAARGPAMPVFLPRAQVLALWYRPAPDQLVVWRAGDSAPRTLPLRLVYLSLRNAEGQPLTSLPGGSGLRLLPLLPVTTPRSIVYDASHTESACAQLDTALPSRLNLWAATYLVAVANTAFVGTLTVPEHGDIELPVRIDAGIMDMNVKQRSIRLLLSEVDEAKRQGAPRQFYPSFDVDVSYHSPIYPANRSVWLTVPATAKTISLHWLGVGVLDNIPLPPSEHQDALELPAWRPGLRVAGSLQGPDGAPLAGKMLNISTDEQQNSDFALRVTTEPDGTFAFSGAQPGELIVNCPEVNANWIITVPAGGATGVVLHVAATPVQLYLPVSWNQSFNVWWLADGKTPARMPLRGSEAIGQDTPPGAGTLWVIDRQQGDGTCTREVLRPGRNDRTPGGSSASLGLMFPLSTPLVLPGPVTLIGQDAWQGAVVAGINPHWQPSPPLGLILGQIDAVPPGRWIVRVDTPSGPVETTVTVTSTGGAARLLKSKE